MKLIYVAGAYRAPSWNGVWDNVMHARDVARKLWLMGFAVICPHTNTIFMDAQDTDGCFLNGDLEILRRCDAVFMLDNWKESVGARGEWTLAKELDIPVFYQEDGYVPIQAWKWSE